MFDIISLKGGLENVQGFFFDGVNSGFKKEGNDLGFIRSDEPFSVSAIFTSNRFAAAPIKHFRKYPKNFKSNFILLNSKNANAMTGENGVSDIDELFANLEKKINLINPIMSSTGVIGYRLKKDKIIAAFDKFDFNARNSHNVATAIMTTDTVNKEVAVSFDIAGKKVTLGGMSKGSGMIHPNMCTMLAFLTTDIAIEKSLLQEAVSEVVSDTFNMITVDGDTSTNDTLLCMANGKAGNDIVKDKNDDYETFKNALFYVCEFLAKKMAADGEGASKLFEAKVVNAKTKEDARTLSRAIVGSNLSKAAIFGCDANFGRFLCAMGYSGAQFDQNDVELFFESKAGRIEVFHKGTPLDFDEDKALEIMKEETVTVFVDMHEGDAEATAWGCDLTYDYVKINADYRS